MEVIPGLFASGGRGRFLHLLMSFAPPTFPQFNTFCSIPPLKSTQFRPLLLPRCPRLQKLRTTLSFHGHLMVTRWDGGVGVQSVTNVSFNTVICLIEAPGAIARLNLIPWSKNWGSELSNGGFGLKIGQILRKLSIF